MEDKAYKHIESNVVIKDNVDCKHCYLRVYADDDETINYGIGDINSNVMLVVPSYNSFNNKYETILDKIRTIYKEHFNRELLDDCYITRSVKCNPKEATIKNNALAYFQCRHKLYAEIKRLKPIKIIIADGDVYNDAKIDILLYKGINIIKIQNPYILCYDNTSAITNFTRNFINAFK